MEKLNLSKKQKITLKVIYKNVNFMEEAKELIKEGYVMEKTPLIKGDGLFFLTNKGEKALKAIIREDKNRTDISERVEKLVPELQDIFPKGKKEGTNSYWKGNKEDIKRRLIKFLEKYGDYEDEVIIKATKKYVDSFNGNYSFMRLLQYFIYKISNVEGVQTVTSDLATYIEHGDEEVDNNWNVNLKNDDSDSDYIRPITKEEELQLMWEKL